MGRVLQGAQVAPLGAGEAPGLHDFLSTLRGERICYVPIRHHSPACSWHLRRVIEERRPAAVLVEGPPELESLVPLILDERTRAPIAIFSTCARGDERHGSYFPLCEYSPELVAIRTAAALGARLRFIDLGYAEQIAAMQGDERRSFFDEAHLRRSDYVQVLVKRTGCRDMNELWDHLFETGFASRSSEQFVADVAAYCWMARRDARAEDLARDGTLAREAAMAAAIREELANGASVVAVTGGFHTAVLPWLVASNETLPKRPRADASAQTTLIRYSFDRLDALNGYAAGMPSPHYYDRFWTAYAKRGDEAYRDTAAEVIIEIGRRTREEGMANALSPADEIAALQQADALAGFRGHAGPNREDVLDAMRSCFVKGGMDAEGVALMALVHRVLAGNAIGEIPPGVSVPPLVEDFRRRAARLRLKIDAVEEKETSLDLYRSRTHRLISRLFHTLRFLEVPFARFEGGPDFVHGTSLERVRELWRYRWSPMTEARLVERSMYGSTLTEAGLNFLRQRIADLERDGQARSARHTVATLIEACRMGLHDEAPELVPLIDGSIAEDSSVASLADALTSLLLLWDSREPLQAQNIEAVSDLAAAAYRRAAFLTPALAAVPDELVEDSIRALLTLAALATAPPHEAIDPNLVFEAVEKLRVSTPVQPALAGVAAGILFGAQRLTEDELLVQLGAFLTVAAASPGQGAGFVRGLLRGRREIAWNVPRLLDRIDIVLGAWSIEEFTRALPELRLAFADLTPSETDKVAAGVAAMHGVAEVVPIDHVSPEQLRFGARVESIVVASLRNDGLAAWLEQD